MVSKLRMRAARALRDHQLLLVAVIAHIVFLSATVTFGVAFYSAHAGGALWDGFKYVGVALAFWASLHGAFDFAVHQGRSVSGPFRGLNLAVLGGSVLLCLLAMALHGRLLLHNLSIQAALGLYVLWDAIARVYYKQRSRYWYQQYRILTNVDVVICLSFAAIAYVPFAYPWIQSHVNGTNVQISATELNAFSAGVSGMVLIIQFLVYIGFSYAFYRYTSVRRNGVLNVEEGYDKWAATYHKGNAIMAVERSHSLHRLQELPLSGTVVDLGCGDGFYIDHIVKRVDRVVAVDQSEPMLTRLRQKLNATMAGRYQVLQESVTSLPMVADASVDSVIACLVVDHLTSRAYRDMLHEAFRILKHDGWIYITDVNPYYECLRQRYAKFIDSEGEMQMIRVFPHGVAETLRLLAAAGFGPPEVKEATVTTEHAETWWELREVGLVGFPLILEYLARKV